MDDAVIQVRGLGKRYRLGLRRSAHGSIREAFADLGASLRRRVAGLFSGGAPGMAGGTFWALQDVSFDVRQGEALAIIGRNGAGKSTLLKILSRITEPTEGEALLRGRVGALLEVGTGFHGELTGRENIYLSGTILGMRKVEIDRRFDEIVAFAGIEEFLDTPVKHYSSGMYVRLAFAVAAHLEPEILVIDEVLAVGDAAFQKKCLGKMGEVARGGRTVLFVSHNMNAVRALCQRGLVLDGGRVVMSGDAASCVDHYTRLALDLRAASDLEPFRRRTAETDVPARFARITVLGGAGLPVVVSGEDVNLEIEIEVRRRLAGATISLVLSKAEGERVAFIFSGDRNCSLNLDPGRHLCRCRLRSLPLTPGTYQLDAGLNASTASLAADAILGLPAFTVQFVPQTGGLLPHRQWGAVHWDQVEWELL